MMLYTKHVIEPDISVLTHTLSPNQTICIFRQLMTHLISPTKSTEPRSNDTNIMLLFLFRGSIRMQSFQIMQLPCLYMFGVREANIHNIARILSHILLILKRSLGVTDNYLMTHLSSTSHMQSIKVSSLSRKILCCCWFCIFLIRLCLIVGNSQCIWLVLFAVL